MCFCILLKRKKGNFELFLFSNIVMKIECLLVALYLLNVRPEKSNEYLIFGFTSNKHCLPLETFHMSALLTVLKCSDFNINICLEYSIYYQSYLFWMLIYFDMLLFLLQDFMAYRSALTLTTGTWTPRNSDQYLRYVHVLQCNGNCLWKFVVGLPKPVVPW